MTVRELMDELRHYDPLAPVAIWGRSGEGLITDLMVYVDVTIVVIDRAKTRKKRPA